MRIFVEFLVLTLRFLLPFLFGAWVTVGRAEIDAKNFDPSTPAKDDFYQHVNGGWLKANPIPAAYGSWGSFNEVDERNKAIIRSILERSAADPKATGPAKRVGDFYASGMDEKAIDAAGVAPLRPELDRIAAIRTPGELAAAIGRFHRFGLTAGFGLYSEQDPGDTTQVIAAISQGGLGLPDRDYYLRDDEKSVTLRNQYVAHVEKMFVLAGDEAGPARTAAAAVMRLETALAHGSKSSVDLRDPVANYHRLPAAEVRKLAPGLEWPAYLAAVGLPEPAAIDVGQPDFLRALGAQLAAAPLADWQAYLRWHLLDGMAPYLASPFVQEHFEFYGRALTGRTALRDRWKRVQDFTTSHLGEALGQLYVADHFPPAAKARMLALVGNLRAALRARLATVEWMDDPTRKAALGKIDAFGVKIGYPDKWIDYSALAIDRGPFALNVLRAAEFASRRDLAKIGRPVDRTEWFMAPQEVNAYYNPTMNEIVFPAGILQPPFFDLAADDAQNYGAIGTVIGHEMTHGFDDSGRKFDASGNLADWWTPGSVERFNARAAAVVAQYNGYVAIDDLRINGELTQGENIADLGGLKVSLAALALSRAGRPETTVGGYTEAQRFFLSYAGIWRTNQRPEVVRLQVNTDPHSPARFRVNGPLPNLPEFLEAFAVPEGAPMRRPAGNRIEIW